MKGQIPISSFFKPQNKQVKRILEKEVIDKVASPLKRTKLGASGDTTIGVSPNAKPDLSSTQLQRIEENKLHARIKLQSKKTPALSANIGVTWFKALEPEFSKDYFQKLSTFVKAEREKYTVYPPGNEVFSWTQMCDISKIKIVILGQDPYHGPGQAHGLAFSVPNGIAIPPSLINMYKELGVDIPGFTTPTHGYLKGWAIQGVLLLNACLTVRAHNANSHKDKGWENLTDAVIKWLNDNLKGVVFLLWGSYAQKKGAFINKKKHLVLQCPHPSPLSANRGFFGCQHFSKANEYLMKCGKGSVDWSDLPVE